MSSTDLGAALSNSLSISSVLIITALGLSITFGVMRVINMAHGDLLMLGAYSAHLVGNLLPGWMRKWSRSEDLAWLSDGARHVAEYALFYAIPVAFILVGLVGYLLEVSLIRFLYGRPLDTLLATWGVGLILQQTILLVFGAAPEPMHLPNVLAGGWEIGDVTVPHYRLFILGFTAACLVGVYLWFFKTSFGLKIRAVVQNRPMAGALGISTRRVDSLTFAFAAGLAGVAGCILGHLYNVKYDMGTQYVVDAFMVVILGGLGQLAGSVGGGLVIGLGNGFLSKFLGNEIMAKVLIMTLVVGFILVRPSGLFTSRERTYD